jgi:hypothetical protein
MTACQVQNIVDFCVRRVLIFERRERVSSAAEESRLDPSLYYELA